VIRVRAAETADAKAIAAIQVAAWRAGYRHILPGRFLAELDESGRAERWRGRIGPAAWPDSPTFVAVDEAGAVLGFVHTGPVRDEDLEPDGRAEVYTVYVDPSAWRRGIGAALMRAVNDFWAPTGVSELVLWVFEANAESRAFYEALGWRPDGATQVDDFGDARQAEVRYRRAIAS
jgi:GNAT superfamily N-acetyltransferase